MLEMDKDSNAQKIHKITKKDATIVQSRYLTRIAQPFD
jgi:hypothetical protein